MLSISVSLVLRHKMGSTNFKPLRSLAKISTASLTTHAREHRFHLDDNTINHAVMTSFETQEHKPESPQEGTMSLIRPPVLAASKVLNKAAFEQTFNIAAASVRDNKRISQIRAVLSKSADLLSLERQPSIVNDPDAALAAQGRKCMLLKPEISAAKPETWGPVLSELVKQDEVGIVPYVLQLGYDYWSYRDVLTTLLPSELHDDIPSGFNTAGHVAHLNLRDQHLPYKMLLAEVLVDKNQHIKTVINKTSDVGTNDQFRTFPYEVLAGSGDLMVELVENGCTFKFDYGTVYWNSRLEKEHTRLINLFKPGEVVCDVMAGIGPFAVPAGKKGVFVWANDYNPESYKYLKDAIKKNKVYSLPQNLLRLSHSRVIGRTICQTLQHRWPRLYPPSGRCRSRRLPS